MTKDLGKLYDLRELPEVSVNCLEFEAHGKCRLLHLLPLPLCYLPEQCNGSATHLYIN